MREVKRAGNLPKPLGPFLESGHTFVKAMNAVGQEDVPTKQPVMYECDTLQEVMEKTADESGQVQIVQDADNERVFAVGLGFGKRLTKESMDFPEEPPEEEWRTILFYAEVTFNEWIKFRESWNEGKADWMKTETAKRAASVLKRTEHRKKRAKFKKTYGRDGVQ